MTEFDTRDARDAIAFKELEAPKFSSIRSIPGFQGKVNIEIDEKTVTMVREGNRLVTTRDDPRLILQSLKELLRP